jgi:hypothetical protein
MAWGRWGQTKSARGARRMTSSNLRYMEVTLLTQTINAGQTVVHTAPDPRPYNVTALIPVGETVTIEATGTLEITGR